MKALERRLTAWVKKTPKKPKKNRHGNGSSAFVFQVMGILKPVTVSTDKGLQLSHSPMVGCHSLYGSNFDSKCGRGGCTFPLG